MTLEKAIEGIRDQNAAGEVRLVKVLQTFTKFYNERRKKSWFSARAEGDFDCLGIMKLKSMYLES